MYLRAGGIAGHIVIFAFPDFGHVKPLLGVTRSLVERGHRVTWVTDLRYEELIRQAGGQLLGFSSTRPAFGSGPVVDEYDMGRLGLAYLAETVDIVLPLAELAFADDVPELVLYDQESVLVARTLMRRWNRRGLQVFPCVASSTSYSLHEEVYDGEHPIVHEVVQLVKNFLAESGADPDDVWGLLTPWDEHNLVLLPRAFQPRGDTFDDSYTFVGHCVDTGEPDRVPWSRPAESVVLVSLGTEAADDEFFRACFEAFAGLRDRHAVLTLGPLHVGLDGADVPPNVERHSWLPHTSVLPFADVFVTHGGMGSVVEALYFGVPMVIVPHTVENWINARRLQELGLGEILAPDEFTAESLADTVARVGGDVEMRRRVSSMRAGAIADGGIPRAVRLIERLLGQWLEDETTERERNSVVNV